MISRWQGQRRPEARGWFHSVAKIGHDPKSCADLVLQPAHGTKHTVAIYCLEPLRPQAPSALGSILTMALDCRRRGRRSCHTRLDFCYARDLHGRCCAGNFPSFCRTVQVSRMIDSVRPSFDSGKSSLRSIIHVPNGCVRHRSTKFRELGTAFDECRTRSKKTFSSAKLRSSSCSAPPKLLQLRLVSENDASSPSCTKRAQHSAQRLAFAARPGSATNW